MNFWIGLLLLFFFTDTSFAREKSFDFLSSYDKQIEFSFFQQEENDDEDDDDDNDDNDEKPPRLKSKIPDHVLYEDASDTKIDLEDYFRNGDKLNYKIDKISNQALFKKIKINNSKLIIDYAKDAFGKSDIRLSAINKSKKKRKTSFKVRLKPVNDAPDFSATNPVIAREISDEQVHKKWANFTPGPDNESDQKVKNYQVRNISNRDMFVETPEVNKRGDLSFKLKPEVSGRSFFKVAVMDNGGTENDGKNISTFKKFEIKADWPNNSPQFTSTPETNAVKGKRYSYQVTTTDPDKNDKLKLTAEEYPEWLNFKKDQNGKGQLTGTPGIKQVGKSYKIVLKVEDKRKAFAEQKFNITVIDENAPPIFTSSPVTTVNENEQYVYNVAATDSDNDDLVISYTKKPSWLNLIDQDNGKAQLKGIPGPEDIADHEVLLKVSDPSGGSASQSFTITVTDVNQPPKFVSQPVKNIKTGQSYSYKIVTEDLDPDDNWNIKILSDLPDWLTFKNNNDGTGILSGTPEEHDAGNYRIVIEAKDNDGNSTRQEFTLNVKKSNGAPYFVSEPVTTAVINNEYKYNIQAQDNDSHDKLKIEVDSNLPVWLHFSDNEDGTALLYGIPQQQHIGKYDLNLKVSDNKNKGSIQQFTITVSKSPEVVDWQLFILEDEEKFFSQKNFKDLFLTTDSKTLALIQITRSPVHGTLRILNNVISEGEEIPVDQLNNLKYTPDQDFFGKDYFSWKGSDGILYSNTSAGIDIEILAVNDAPAIVNLEPEPLQYVPDKALKIPITTSAIIEDVDDDSLTNAQIFFNARSFEPELDMLHFENAGIIQGTFSKETGTLILRGRDSKENYNEVLKSVTYEFLGSMEPGINTRIINIFADDGKERGIIVDREIEMIKLADMIIPSGFTPNNDLANDTWIIDNIGLYPECMVRIFTKAGKEIYSSIGYQEPWDGTFNGDTLPVGTYFYVITFSSKNSIKGTVTIIR